MTTEAVTTADWRALEGVIAGQVILPISPEYDLARLTANARSGRSARVPGLTELAQRALGLAAVGSVAR